MSATDALEAALAGEHAAVYAYGVVGARLQGHPDERQARSGYDAHRQRRSTITRMLSDAGATPAPAAAAYDLGGPVLTAAAARTLAAGVETRAAADVRGRGLGRLRVGAPGRLAVAGRRLGPGDRLVRPAGGVPGAARTLGLAAHRRVVGRHRRSGSKCW